MNRYDQRVRELGGEVAPFLLELGYGPVSEEQCRIVEAAIGHTLPDDYREFLRDYGGYSFVNARCPFTRGQAKTFGDPSGTTTLEYVETFFTYAPRTSLDLATKYRDEFAPFEVLYICHAGGNQQYLLDLTGKHRSTIYLYVMDDATLYPIAPSFDEFLHKLVVVED